ncbi:hypothetical protein SK128_014119 [Halocaridina rubra]|uniref:Uncharacterized protein n=1 Tax=Halocaridina rubra TaxID=373956 RepID=A0AAN8XEK9_HALRR
MATSPSRWKRIFFLSLSLIFTLASTLSEAGKSKNFIRSSNNYHPQDQPQRTFYAPESAYNRFRRNFGGSDDSGSQIGYPGFSSSFSSPRRSSFNARKGGSRGFGGSDSAAAAFGLGGPEAFLEPGTTERNDFEDSVDTQAFKFPGSGGFGNMRPRPIPSGRKGGAKGGAKGGGFKSPAFSFGGSSEGSQSPGFGQDSSPKFSFPGSSAAAYSGQPNLSKFGGFPNFGGPSGQDNGGSSALEFGGSSNLEYGGSSSSLGSSSFRGTKTSGYGNGNTAYFSGSSGISQPARNPYGSGGFPSPSNPSFTGSLPTAGSQGSHTFVSNSESFPPPIQFPPPSGGNQFPPPGGGNPFPQPGKQFDLNALFSQPIDSDSPIVFPPNTNFGGPNPPNLPFPLNEELLKLFVDTQTTTPKPPLRVTSSEDINKVFSNNNRDEDGEEYDAEELYDLFGENIKKVKVPELRRGCITRPASPANGRTDCSSYSGCRAICDRNYEFPTGERRLFLECDEEDGQWKVAGDDWDSLPDCIPICSPECQNNGICLAPNVCECPDNWEGPTCEIPKAPPKKECGNKPPTPMNSRIYCSKDECTARCYEDYHFEEGTSRLTFKCMDGKWVIPDSRWSSTPDCEPICDPECINDGRCIAPDVCECTPDFRGKSCQYPITNCDPKKLGFNGGYNCSGEGMDFGCALWCPVEVDFEFPAADFYKCDYATGLWSPSPIPKCDYSFLSLKTPDPFGVTWGAFPTDFPFVVNEIDSEGFFSSKNMKKSPGTCVTWSGSHYKSFDGKIYSFESSCPYTLVQDSTHGTFSINLKTADDCEGPSCPKKIQLFLEDDEYVLQTTDSGHPSLAYHETSLAIPGQMNGVISERVAHFVVLKVSDLGLTIKWDMQMLVIVEISEFLWNRTSGLCGRRDGIEENDWSYTDGTVENKITNFLQAWQAKTLVDRCIEQPMVKPPCTRHPESSRATDFCNRLNTDPRFADCLGVVDVEPYINSCRWDFCSCESRNNEDCACETFSAYFRECTAAGVEIPGGWRSPELCPMVCEQGKVYNPCMSAIQPRCGQPSEIVRPEFCVEGCDCPGELVLHEGKCINAKDCPCTYRNKAYSAGDTIPNDCNSCTCLGGEWICTEVKCGSRCASVGDPHYTTFDGRRYDFMGKCSYYLVQASDFSIEAENTPCAGAVSELYLLSVDSMIKVLTRSYFEICCVTLLKIINVIITVWVALDIPL